jgi:isoquinoline 1-oxidoreductase beta subunit
MKQPNLSRNEFIKVTALGGAGLLISIYLSGCSQENEINSPISQNTPTSLEDPEYYLFEPSIYATIDSQGVVTFTSFRSEMGQGSRTALAMAFADELEIPWSAIQITQADADPVFGNQVTGGSGSISDYFTTVRRAGAAARTMLVAAAAEIWNVSQDDCTAQDGFVIHPDSQTQLSYGELAKTAAEQPVPMSFNLALKDPQDFKIIGTDQGHYDTLEMITGKAQYASDIVLPEMLYAVLARCPIIRGNLESFNDQAARQIPGVVDVFEIQGKVAVIAKNTWAALKGRAALEIVWNKGSQASLSSEELFQSLIERVGPTNHDPENGYFVQDYFIPFQAHATMEPMSCVAAVHDDSCEIWAPSQNPQEAQVTGMSHSRLPRESVIVHVPLIGGGFGRRLQSDFVEEAVMLSKQVGKPIKLFWTREDDIQNDFYHPQSISRVSGRLENPGRQGVSSSEITNQIPTGAWRSVFNFTEAFPRESFIDEVAAYLGEDPLEVRRQTLSPRALAVVELAAEKAGWGTPLPAGKGRGLAYFATFGVTHVAYVTEVSIDQANHVHVDRVICAVDCGIVVNPDNVKAQIEGGIAFALTATLKAQITLADGRIEQSNFHDYPLLTISEMPKVEVHFVHSNRAPTGIGEMGVPPLAPAVANAIFAATGKRIRHLPITPEDLNN